MRPAYKLCSRLIVRAALHKVEGRIIIDRGLSISSGPELSAQIRRYSPAALHAVIKIVYDYLASPWSGYISGVMNFRNYSNAREGYFSPPSLPPHPPAVPPPSMQ